MPPLPTVCRESGPQPAR